ncbi:MAG: hypothetical protein HYX66_07730 [Ignavibacteria bacterium]|nr:hypothetical protein [Ignavibacteria bacterium]
MKTLIGLLAALSVIMLFCSCESSTFPVEAPTVKDNLSFSLDIQPILSSNCARCHYPGNILPDLREGYAYESLMEGDGITPGNAEESELVEMLEGGGNNPMPPSTKLSPVNIELIKKWIDEGAKDN